MNNPSISDFEQAFVNALVAQIFQPQVVGTTYDGQPSWGNAPGTTILNQMFAAHKDEIIDRVIKRTTAENVAEEVAPKILALLAETPKQGWYSSSTETGGEKFQKAVWDRTVELLAQAKADEIRASMSEED